MDDPTVIVGLACRVPGAQNPSQLWDHIIEQKDVQRKIPSDRFNVDAFYHPDGTNKGTVRLVASCLASYVMHINSSSKLGRPASLLCTSSIYFSIRSAVSLMII